MKTVLITGANRGIGLALANVYQAKDVKVIGTARKPDQADELKASGAEVLELDVSKPDSIASLKASLGDMPIDLLIHNAGMGGNMKHDFGSLDYDYWQQIFDVNTLGPLRIIEALTVNVARSELKRIVCLSSQLGSVENASSDVGIPYRSSKAALNMALKVCGPSFGS